MTGEQWARTRDLFHQALDVPVGQRPEWFEQLSEDAEIVTEVQSLVRSHEDVGAFLHSSAIMDPRDLLEGAETGADGPATDATLTPGLRIGDYEIRREIGRGGMGVVYLAQDVNLGRLAAIKSLPAALSEDPVLLERLRREARTAVAVTHSGVATVYALIESPHGTFIASEFIQGRTLRQEMARGPLPPARAMRLAIEIADALCTAHDAHVVHRDLKPENVLLTASGGVKVIDFGIARMEVPGASKASSTHGLVGTPGYMAPEQLLAGAIVDGRADLYALGIILSEMLTGRHPFERPSGITHAELLSITRRCLESDPDRRYQSARDLLRDLQRVSLMLDGAAAEIPITDPAPERPRLWWWQFHQAAAVLVYAVIGVPAWAARTLIGRTYESTGWAPIGRTLFFVTLVSLILASILRLHLWFTARLEPDGILEQARLVKPWMTTADIFASLSLIASGVLIGEAQMSLAVLLLSVGTGTVVVALFVEPATARAAFAAARR